jgi:hypothetical protein
VERDIELRIYICNFRSRSSVAGGVPSTVQGSSDLSFERTFAASGYLNSHMVRVRYYLELDH